MSLTFSEEPKPLPEQYAPDDVSDSAVDFSKTSSQDSKMDLALAALSGKTSAPPSQAATRPSPIVGEGIPEPLTHGDTKPKPLHFTKTGAVQAEPKGTFNPVKPQRICDPPCIQGRGVCNDDVCFCKTPYTGTTCQHKLGGWMRISYALLGAACVVSLFMGSLLAQIVHAIVQSSYEKRLSWLGDGIVNKELWAPPETKRKPGAK